MKNIKSIVTFLFFAFATISAFSQEDSIAAKKSQVSFRAGGGLSTLNYTLATGDRSNGMGGNIGIGYNYFITPTISLGTGVEFSMYNSTTKISSLVGSYNAYDIVESENFTFNYNFSNFEEKQSVSMLTIPILVNYESMGKNAFYASAGVRIGIPISAKFDQKSSSMYTSGFYASDGKEYNENGGDPFPEQGFITSTNYKASGDITLDVSAMLSLETGIKWALSGGFKLYTGIFFDYGLNYISSVSDKTVITYNSNQASKLTNNSVINSSMTGSTPTAMVDKVQPIAFGVKLGLSLGLPRK